MLLLLLLLLLWWRRQLRWKRSCQLLPLLPVNAAATAAAAAAAAAAPAAAVTAAAATAAALLLPTAAAALLPAAALLHLLQLARANRPPLVAAPGQEPGYPGPGTQEPRRASGAGPAWRLHLKRQANACLSSAPPAALGAKNFRQCWAAWTATADTVATVCPGTSSSACYALRLGGGRERYGCCGCLLLALWREALG